MKNETRRFVGYRNRYCDSWMSNCIGIDRKMTIKFDSDKVFKIAKILNKYDKKLPFECMIELSKLIEDKK